MMSLYVNMFVENWVMEVDSEFSILNQISTLSDNYFLHATKLLLSNGPVRFCRSSFNAPHQSAIDCFFIPFIPIFIIHSYEDIQISICKEWVS